MSFWVVIQSKSKFADKKKIILDSPSWDLDFSIFFLEKKNITDSYLPGKYWIASIFSHED